MCQACLCPGLRRDGQAELHWLADYIPRCHHTAAAALTRLACAAAAAANRPNALRCPWTDRPWTKDLLACLVLRTAIALGHRQSKSSKITFYSTAVSHREYLLPKST